MLSIYKKQYWISVVCFIVSGSSMLLIPVSSMDEEGMPRVLAYITAAVFWLGIIAGAIIFASADSKRKKLEKKLAGEKSRKRKKGRAGFISFFRNKEAAICDIVMLLSLAALVVFAVAAVEAGWIIALVLALFLCSFYLHSFLNGKNYIFIKTAKKSKVEENKDE